MELGTDDMGRVQGYDWDVCRDGFRKAKAQMQRALARDAKSYQKGFYKGSEKKGQGECTALTNKKGQLVAMDMKKGVELKSSPQSGFPQLSIY